MKKSAMTDDEFLRALDSIMAMYDDRNVIKLALSVMKEELSKRLESGKTVKAKAVKICYSPFILSDYVMVSSKSAIRFVHDFR